MAFFQREILIFNLEQEFFFQIKEFMILIFFNQPYKIKEIQKNKTYQVNKKKNCQSTFLLFN